VIGVLVSGEGTNVQALIDAGLPVVAVASSRKDAYALERARAAGIPTAVFALDCHDSRTERDLVMATWLEQHGVELVVLAGFMEILTRAFLDRFPGVIAQEPVPVEPSDTLEERIHAVEHRLLPAVVRELLSRLPDGELRCAR